MPVVVWWEIQCRAIAGMGIKPRRGQHLPPIWQTIKEQMTKHSNGQAPMARDPKESIEEKLRQ